MASGHPAKSHRFADLLRGHRLKAGFSQEHLAEIARMSVTAIGSLERGVRLAPYRATVDLLADALGLDDAARVELESAASRARGRGRHAALAGSPRHNLPPSRTSFVGRQSDLSRLSALMLRQRQSTVTITGFGGVGKSRLAIEAAREMADAFDEGIWLVQLAWITDPELVPNAMASVLGIQGRDDRPLMETLAQALRRRKLLFILDNCEHVLPGAAAAVATIEAMCPGVMVLATSREPLGLPSELNYSLGTLEIPPGRVCSFEEVLTFAAADLFCRRAASLGPGVFDLTEQTVSAVVDIVRRLDGLPLAIELAAAKLSDLRIDDLARGLQDRFGLLVDYRQGELPRHQALWALIDWSYETLSDDERFVFESCTVFAGPFTIDAVVAVAARDPLRNTALYDAFTSLVAKSLIGVAGRAERRYGMLETIREYARGQIRDDDRVEELRRKHAEHYLNVARRVHEASEHAAQVVTLRRLFAERSNFEAALTWSLGEAADPLLGARLCGALSHLLANSDMRSRRWILLAAEHIDPKESPETFADLTMAATLALPYAPDPGSRVKDLERAVDTYRSNGNVLGQVTALGNRATLCRMAGDFRAAAEVAKEAVRLARTLSSPRRLAWTLYHYGQSVTWDEPERAAHLFREALEIYHPSEPDTLFSMTLSALAEVEYRLGRVGMARDLTKRAAMLLEPEPDLYGFYRAIILGEYSAYALTLGDIAPAREAAREALRIELEVGMTTLTSFAIQHLAFASALLGDVRRAAALLGYCIKVTENVANLGIDKDFREHALRIVSSQLSPLETQDLLRAGASWSEDRAAEEAFRV